MNITPNEPTFTVEFTATAAELDKLHVWLLQANNKPAIMHKLIG